MLGLWPADAVDYFQQVAAINPKHAPTQAFLARLAEAGIDVNAWQRGENVDGDEEGGGDGAAEGGGEGAPEAMEIKLDVNDINL